MNVIFITLIRCNSEKWNCLSMTIKRSCAPIIFPAFCKFLLSFRSIFSFLLSIFIHLCFPYKMISCFLLESKMLYVNFIRDVKCFQTMLYEWCSDMGNLACKINTFRKDAPKSFLHNFTDSSQLQIPDSHFYRAHRWGEARAWCKILAWRLLLIKCCQSSVRWSNISFIFEKRLLIYERVLRSYISI